jgi:UTP--glucose-1-phosphate uridylyltransferase
MSIKKAVITAAGKGTRFLPVSNAYQKEMVPLMNKPQLQCVIEEAIEAEIHQIAVVVRKEVKTFVNYLENNDELWKFLKKTGKQDRMESYKQLKENCELTIIEQTNSDPYGNGTPFIKARDFLDGDDFVAMWGDDVTVHTDASTPTLLEQLMGYFDKYNPTAVMAVKKVPKKEICLYGSYEYIPEEEAEVPYQVCDVIEKPDPDEAPSLYANAARFVFSYKVIEELEKKIEGKDNELWLVDAVMRLIHNGEKVMAVPWKGAEWIPLGDPVRWLKGNLIYALNHEEFAEDVKKFLREDICKRI